MELRLVVNKYGEIVVLGDGAEPVTVIKATKYASYYKTLFALYEEVDISSWPNCRKVVTVARQFLRNRINKVFGTNFDIELAEAVDKPSSYRLKRISQTEKQVELVATSRVT